MQTHLHCRGWRSILHSQCARLGATIRRSHSRPNEVPPSKRERLLWRPQDTFQRQTGRSPKDKGLFFLAAPAADVTEYPESERNPRFSHWRWRIKKVKTFQELNSCLLTATQKAEVDSSVFGAAMQKCGHLRWWDALLEVYRIQCGMDIFPAPIQRRIFLTALGNCLKDRSISCRKMNERKVKGLLLGKQIWQGMSVPSTATEYNMALGAALSLCAAVGEAALPWASEIFDELPDHIQKSVFVYTPLLSLYEQTRHHLKVEELLKEMVSKSQPPNVVTLGELMNAAGSDWKRAEQIWNHLVGELNVTPNVICYVAYAKGSILAGRPFGAMMILDTMWNEGLGDDNNNAAVVYLQALLIACHSDLSRFSARLSSYLEETHGTIGPSMKHAGKQMKRQWNQMTSLGHSLLACPMTVKFRDLLVYENAKQGEMKNWKDHSANSKYLMEEQDTGSAGSKAEKGVRSGHPYSCW